jgi:nucleoside-diphosphate-sugar epimerase
MTRTALVLGAGGFIGGPIVHRLKREGFWVRELDLKFPEFRQVNAPVAVHFSGSSQHRVGGNGDDRRARGSHLRYRRQEA